MKLASNQHSSSFIWQWIWQNLCSVQSKQRNLSCILLWELYCRSSLWNFQMDKDQSELLILRCSWEGYSKGEGWKYKTMSKALRQNSSYSHFLQCLLFGKIRITICTSNRPETAGIEKIVRTGLILYIMPILRGAESIRSKRKGLKILPGKTSKAHTKEPIKVFCAH